VIHVGVFFGQVAWSLPIVKTPTSFSGPDTPKINNGDHAQIRRAGKLRSRMGSNGAPGGVSEELAGLLTY